MIIAWLIVDPQSRKPKKGTRPYATEATARAYAFKYGLGMSPPRAAVIPVREAHL